MPHHELAWGQATVSISLHAWKQRCIAEAVCCVLVAAWLLRPVFAWVLRAECVSACVHTRVCVLMGCQCEGRELVVWLFV
jgi:hypothetical protein